MKKPHFFKKIKLSMTSKIFYKSIMHEHFMKALLYLTLLTFLISLPFTIYQAFTAATKLTDITSGFPEFTLEKGVLEIPSNEPFVYKEKSKKLIILADTTGTYTVNHLVGYETGYLFTEKAVLMYQSGAEPQSLKYTDFIYFPLNSAYLDLLRQMKPLLIVMSVGVSLFLALLLNLLKSLFSCSLGYLIKNGLALPLTFSQTYKVVIYSMTAPLIVLELLKFIPIPMIANISFAVYIFIHITYLVEIFRHMKNQHTDISV